MSSGSFKQVDVLCPFYLSDDGCFHISCECPGGGKTLTLYYTHKQDQAKQLEVFCCNHYSKCEIARAVMEKYN